MATIKLTKERAGAYRYENYLIYKWKPEVAGLRALWCVSLSDKNGENWVGLDDFTTLAKAKQYLMERVN
jgi:hypothetical protein